MTGKDMRTPPEPPLFPRWTYLVPALPFIAVTVVSWQRRGWAFGLLVGSLSAALFLSLAFWPRVIDELAIRPVAYGCFTAIFFGLTGVGFLGFGVVGGLLSVGVGFAVGLYVAIRSRRRLDEQFADTDQ